MKPINKEDLARAREMDLLTYLTYYDPGNLKHVSGITIPGTLNTFPGIFILRWNTIRSS